ncbi:putative mediator of RNA polymerase II transcription subunit 26, partial [Lucilia cuprina]|uniref:putative mediator of RNA polymerase II transcription subunit 26 n=1 Tax=Lucilia cuprina TaxID=7375 RepID=UPI001F067619
MKFCLKVSLLCLLFVTVIASEETNSTITKKTNSKVAEKLSYPKKVSSIKKNPSRTSLKKIADITEKFKDLPADDLAFIKELDKQFKLHGGKVKIKVENKNVTESKNSKRTIDGELGYGYAHNGYQYNPPKFMFYPYSQQNIGNNAPNYFLTGDGKTEVSIEPSYSYELKTQSYIAQSGPQIDVPKPELQQQMDHYQTQQHQGQQQHQYEEPVIVLRIPGPAKYASHLQMLLQKYLEIRAAQYLRILEEAEQRNNQQHQLQQLDYGHGNTAISDGQAEHVEHHQSHVPISDQHDYQQQVQYDHQIAVTPQPLQYPEIDSVYQSYKHRHSSQPEQPLQEQQSYYAPQQGGEEQQAPQYQHQLQYQSQEQYQQQEHQPQYQQQGQEQPQFYYTHQQQYAQPEGPPANTYQNVFLLSMMPQGHSEYEASQAQPEKQQPIYVQEQTNQNEHSSTLPVAENNPRPSHTKVVFTNKNDNSAQDYQMYQLPSIKPNDRHTAASVPDYHQDFQQQIQYQNLQENQNPQESSTNYQQHYNNAELVNPEVATATQRPYNYHAHNVKARARGRTAHTRRAASA